MEEIAEREPVLKKHVQKTAERAAKEAGMRTMVELCQEFGLNDSETIQRVMDKSGCGWVCAKQKVER